MTAKYKSHHTKSQLRRKENFFDNCIVTIMSSSSSVKADSQTVRKADSEKQNSAELKILAKDK